MQLITEAWQNLPPAERAPFDAQAQADRQRYLQEERVYYQLRMQYSRLKNIAQQSGVLAAPQTVAGPGRQHPQPQQLPAALNNNTTANNLLHVYSQAAAQTNYGNQHQRQMHQQYVYQRQQEQRQQAATAAQPQLRAAVQIAAQAQQRRQQVQQANPAAFEQQQEQSVVLYSLSNAVDRNNTAGRMPTAQAQAPQRSALPPSSLQPGGRNQPPHSRPLVPPAAQFGGTLPGWGSRGPHPPVSASKVPLQHQWKGGPVGSSGGGGRGRGFAVTGGAFAPPSFKNNKPKQQKSTPNSQQYNGKSSQRYSAAAVARRQQERAVAAAAAAAAARSSRPATVDRRPTGSDQYKIDTAVKALTGRSVYTPWRDVHDGKFVPINVRWSGERCAVCEADTDYDYDQLITCDICGITVHQSCYGVQDVSGVEKMWLCRACEIHDAKSNNGNGSAAAQCCLCPIAGGALKPTTIQGIWAHVTCLQWIPEVSVDDTELMEPISGIRSIQRERWELVCYVCKQRMGAKIQCKSCCNAYHPLCARIAGFKMEIKDGTRGPDGPVVCTSYCGKHSTPQPHRAGVRKVDESETGGDLPTVLEKPRLWNCQPYPLPKCFPIVVDFGAGCARAMKYNLRSRGLIRKQHGCGTGATTEAAFWIPGSMIDNSEEEQEEDEKKVEQAEKNKEAENEEKGKEAHEEEPIIIDGDENASTYISRRTKSKRSYNNGPGSAAHVEGEPNEQEKHEERHLEGGKVEVSNGIITKTPRKPDDAETAVDTTKNTIAAMYPGTQRVDSPPGMRTVGISLRPAVKKSSDIDGERPPAKLRKLNTLHAEEKPPCSFMETPEAPLCAVEVKEEDAAAATAGALAAPCALVAGRLSSELVGHWCRIWWPEDNEWYLGVIREYSPAKGQFRVWYEVDSEAEWIDLSREARNNRVQLLDGEERNKWPVPLPIPADIRDNGGLNAEEINADTNLEGSNLAITTAAAIDNLEPATDNEFAPTEDHQVPVICNGVCGTFYSKSMSVVITHSGKEVTPGAFERVSGRGPAKKWKSTIRLDIDGQPGKSIESWLIKHGICGEDGKPFARNKDCTGNRFLKGEEAVTAQLHHRKQPMRTAKNKLSSHKENCGCVICKQNRKRAAIIADDIADSGNNNNQTSTSAIATAAAGATAHRSGQQQLRDKYYTTRQRNSRGRYGQDEERFHDPHSFRTGKQAYIEAIPQIVSSGPRSLELYQAPPSRCWAPGEWAAHRLRYNRAREAKRSGGNSSLASSGQHESLPVIVCGGSLAIQDDNIATVISLGPGATGFGRTLTLKEKLDLCNATEHERLSFGKSGIHGWGIFARVPMRQDTMVVEFRGELLRRSAAETREAKYLVQGADCYIFNLNDDDDVVLDATKAGTIARFTVR